MAVMAADATAVSERSVLLFSVPHDFSSELPLLFLFFLSSSSSDSLLFFFLSSLAFMCPPVCLEGNPPPGEPHTGTDRHHAHTHTHTPLTHLLLQ